MLRNTLKIGISGQDALMSNQRNDLVSGDQECREIDKPEQSQDHKSREPIGATLGGLRADNVRRWDYRFRPARHSLLGFWVLRGLVGFHSASQ